MFNVEVLQIFKDNTQYINPSQAVNQASSLDALSGDLYTDSTRFIYELLQNADDSSSNNNLIKVWIKIFDEYLVIAHSGTPFNIQDIRGICNVNNGTKKSDITKTGYKGIGFKSVFGQSNYVTIYTNNEYLRFDSSYKHKWDWEKSQEEWEINNGRAFQFPWQIIPIYTKEEEIPKHITQFIKGINANVATIVKLNNASETSISVEKISQNTNLFLFLKNICEITFDIEKLSTVKINRPSKDKISIQKNNSEEINWLANTIQLPVPTNVKNILMKEKNIPDKLINASSIELTLVAKLGKNGISKLSQGDKLLYSYLPTDERNYPLPVLVNTNFLTSANRESLHIDSKWNQWIFKEIAIEIFKWISKLALSEFKSQAYQLIPSELTDNDLGKEFNSGIKDALNEIPFILSKEDELLKVEETIVDYTLLSDKSFIDSQKIKNFVSNCGPDEKKNIPKKFAKDFQYFRNFKLLGAKSFEWKNLKNFLMSPYFRQSHTIDRNIELIKFLKKVANSERFEEVSNQFVTGLPFIWDHKNVLNYPNQVCFPEAGDKNWQNKDNELSFIHPSLLQWLSEDLETRRWLEDLGMTEKTDITYITQKIIPNIETYITKENAITIVRELFNLYKNGSLSKEILQQLNGLKLLTTTGSLHSAKDCYFSNYYNPRLKIEDLLEIDNLISELYCTNLNEKDDWKIFFKHLGVEEGISKKILKDKFSSSSTDIDIISTYFNTDDKKFKPFVSEFTANEFSNITTLKLSKFTENNFKFASPFWSDYINNFNPDNIEIPAIAFWGRNNYEGRTTGDKIQNYVPWLIRNKKCIPTLSNTCETTHEVFLNTNDIKDISSKYLPVFNGPDLTSDWRAFFGFKTSLCLNDYLTILEKISNDMDDNGRIKKSNIERVQLIYEILLDKCVNWSSSEIEIVSKWAENETLLNTKMGFSECKNLKCFIDGNESIFQDQYSFILLNAENRKNPHLEILFQYFGVQLLKQDEFQLISTKKEECVPLKSNLQSIIPYLLLWINSSSYADNLSINIEKLNNMISSLMIFQSDKLEITYEGINFVKSVNTHYSNSTLYVTNPWNSNSVFLNLSNILCNYLELTGHEEKLDFLLRSTKEEILDYFIQEELGIPEQSLYDDLSDSQTTIKNINSFKDIRNAIDTENVRPEFFHLSRSDYNSMLYVESLISRAVPNILAHLGKLPEYDCSHHYNITDSIIGGITKNGNNVTIVARPSDNHQVLIYYTSEFDVLEHVDAELWYEDGINVPKKITLGQLLKTTGINRIPINNIDIKEYNWEHLEQKTKSEVFEFNAVPFDPYKIAQIISSFANTKGGKLIFGMKEIDMSKNEIVGLSDDFPMLDIIQKSISLLSIPSVITYNWIKNDDKKIFIIETKKAEEEILLEGKKYIRQGIQSIHERKEIQIIEPEYNRTVAVIIAIEEYAPRSSNQISKVKYAKADAYLFKKMLEETMYITEDDITMIINEKALKSNLEYDLKSLFASLTEQDRLIFYYVGHGFHNGVTNYLSTYDMHPSNINETAISLQHILLNPLQESKCKNALIFIDACAQAFQNPMQRNSITDINDEEIRVLISEFPYYATFLSCQPGESSYSSDDLKHGIWTYHLVDAMNGNVSDILLEKKYLTDISLQEYLSKKVPIYTKEELEYEQNPKAVLDSSRSSIIVKIKKDISFK